MARYEETIIHTPDLIGYWPFDDASEPFRDATPAANVQAIIDQNLAKANPRFEVDQAGWISSSSWGGTVTAVGRTALPAGALPAPAGSAYAYRIAGTKTADTSFKTLGFVTDTAYAMPVTPGANYTITADVYVATLPSDSRFRFDRLYQDATGTQVGTTVSGASFVLTAGWNRVTWTNPTATDPTITTMRINPEWATSVASDVGDLYVTNLTVAPGSLEPPIVTQTNHPLHIGGSSQQHHQASLLPSGEGFSVGTQTSGIITWPDASLSVAQVSPYNDGLYTFPGAAPFTLEVWTSPSAIGGQRFIMAKRNTDSSGGWALQNFDKEFRLSRYGSTSAAVNSPSGVSVLPVDVVRHLVSTFDGTTARLYIDGTESASAASTPSIVRHGYPLTFFRDSDANGGQYVGFMQHAAIYNRALTANEVNSHFAMGQKLLRPLSSVVVLERASSASILT